MSTRGSKVPNASILCSELGSHAWLHMLHHSLPSGRATVVHLGTAVCPGSPAQMGECWPKKPQLNFLLGSWQAQFYVEPTQNKTFWFGNVEIFHSDQQYQNKTFQHFWINIWKFSFREVYIFGTKNNWYFPWNGNFWSALQISKNSGQAVTIWW